MFCNDIAPVHLPLLARSEAALGRVPAHEALPQAWTPFAPRGVVAREAALASTSVPSLTISDVTRVEGNSGQAAFVFTVSLSAASSKVVSVNYATANGSAETSTGDYVGKSGTLNFRPGQTTRTITVFVNGDTAVEVDETFFINLSQARNAFIADAQGIGTILNDDADSGGGGGGGCNVNDPCGPLPPPPDEGA